MEAKNGVTLTFDSQRRSTCDKRTRATNLCMTTVGAEQRVAVRRLGGTGNVT